MSGPLQGLKIVEMVGLGPAPFAAMMLADQGAEVIRIHAKGQRPDIPLMNTRFDVLARGRRSIALDLKVPGAVDLALELIGQADGLIEGFRPGVM
ncbi:MAG: CoA-transferase family, partial [Pseudomonadota bacterium]